MQMRDTCKSDVQSFTYFILCSNPFCQNGMNIHFLRSPAAAFPVHKPSMDIGSVLSATAPRILFLRSCPGAADFFLFFLIKGQSRRNASLSENLFQLLPGKILYLAETGKIPGIRCIVNDKQISL